MKMTFKTLAMVLAIAAFGMTAEAKNNPEVISAVEFDEGQTDLSTKSMSDLDAIVAEARTKGPIDEIRVAAWSDSAYNGEGTKLSKAERELAAKRADSVKAYLKDRLKVADVDTYNMAKPAGTISQFFKTTESKVKNQFASGDGSNASKAVVMVVLEN